MREVTKNYIEQFNHTLNMPNICWWVIDFEDDPNSFYCNEYMEDVFSLDKSLEKHSVAETCPIAGDYNKNILEVDSSSEKAKTIFDEYKQLLKLERENYHNTFPYFNPTTNSIEYFSSRAKALEHDDEGKIAILFGIIEDITIQETQRLQLEEAQSITKLGSWSYDIVNKKFSCTREMYKIFEIEEIKDPYKEFTEIIHSDDKERVIEVYNNSLEKKEPYELIYRLVLKDKKIKWVKEQAKIIFDKNGVALTTIGTIQDITKEQEYNELLKKKDKQLFESNKLFSMGEMLNNIAHQWRQPLSSISTLSSGTSLYCENSDLDLEQLRTNLDKITTITEELSKTIDDFNNFFEPDVESTEFIMEELFEKTISIARPILNIEYIEIVIDNLSNCTVFGPISEYVQILMSLINNSKDAFENMTQDRKLIKIKSEKIDNICTIQLEDNAGGIPENIMDRIFEPYFTTKHKSQGIGLGLYMTKEVLEKHLKGTIEVENTDVGTRFIIKIANGMCKLEENICKTKFFV